MTGGRPRRSRTAARAGRRRPPPPVPERASPSAGRAPPPLPRFAPGTAASAAPRGRMRRSRWHDGSSSPAPAAGGAKDGRLARDVDEQAQGRESLGPAHTGLHTTEVCRGLGDLADRRPLDAGLLDLAPVPAQGLDLALDFVR